MKEISQELINCTKNVADDSITACENETLSDTTINTKILHKVSQDKFTKLSNIN